MCLRCTLTLQRYETLILGDQFVQAPTAGLCITFLLSYQKTVRGLPITVNELSDIRKIVAECKKINSPGDGERMRVVTLHHESPQQL